MTRKLRPSVDDDAPEDVEGNPADVFEQSLPAYPATDAEYDDTDDTDDEYPLEADPADVAAQRQAVPPPPEPPE